MPVICRVISIGTLASHPLRNEPDHVRTGHATTTLINAGGARVLVDPSLPVQVLAARLEERAGITPDHVTHIFLTSFDRDRRRCLGAFPQAQWMMGPVEREHAAHLLAAEANAFKRAGDPELVAHNQFEQEVLATISAAEDTIAAGVDLFPLPGVTLGTCGLILSQPTSTVLVCGDAVPTVEHLEQGKVLPGCADVEQAQESFREAVEIADILVLGRDNWASNPLRGMV
jgi:glyoxylase-like metal-dependent hydrolase (beta-lactamase superfamily II)